MIRGRKKSRKWREYKLTQYDIERDPELLKSRKSFKWNRYSEGKTRKPAEKQDAGI